MKKLLLLSLLSVTAFCHEVIEDQSNLKIETPALATRSERKIRLDNGLEALLISDPETKESGAALAVAVGSWDDPEERPGMAHFVEHLLFLGTEKYPEEEGYTRYLDEHGGTRNAFTMADRTVYMFSVNNAGFSEALDRFGQFFIAPLFTPSGVDRECKAIHQEYCKNLPLDGWRVHYVKKELANESHPFHRFCIGNSESLARISQDELKEWYQDHYSANLMHLVVLSPTDLDTLESEVVELFSEVKNKEKSPSSFSEAIMSADSAAKMVAVAPVQDVQILELSWELPRFFGSDHETHSDKLVSHVLGHEGKSSLLAQLKREGLAESLGAGAFNAGKDQTLFTLSVQLTSKGIQEHEQVISRCFEAIAGLRQTGIPRYLFTEVVQLEELKYRLQSRDEVFEEVMEIAARLVDEPLETFPRKSLIPSSYAPERIQELVESLTPEKCQYALVAHPTLTQIEPTAKERWLGVEYGVLALDETCVKQWSEAKPHKNISIPRPNPYLPDTIAVEGVANEEKSLPTPTLLVDSPKGKVYSCPDDRFLVPEVSWTFTLKSPAIDPARPKSLALADLYCLAVNERLNTTAYEAMIAGLSYTLKTTQEGLELSVVGYRDKAEAFLRTILAAMETTRPSKEDFFLYREQMARDYFNTANASPLKQGSEELQALLYKHYASSNARGMALGQLTHAQLDTFCNTLFQESYVEGMLYGNGATTGVWEAFETTIAKASFPADHHPHKELALLAAEMQPGIVALKSEHPANALILTADCGPFTFERRAAQEILTKGLEEPFFSELRTRQQTAYIVTNWSQELQRHLYTFFAIQSSSHDTRDLLARFELFLESSLQELQESVIPQERFEAIQAALVYKLEHPAENLSKMGKLLHLLAFEYDGGFDWLERRKTAIQELSYEEFLGYAQEFLGKENPRRLALFVNGALPSEGRLSYKRIK